MIGIALLMVFSLPQHMSSRLIRTSNSCVPSPISWISPVRAFRTTVPLPFTRTPDSAEIPPHISPAASLRITLRMKMAMVRWNINLFTRTYFIHRF